MLADSPAAEIERLLRALPFSIAVELPGGLRLGPSSTAATVVLNSPTALKTLTRHPSLLGLAEAFIARDIDVVGDLMVAVEAAYAVEDLTGISADDIAFSMPPDGAVRFHYDLSNDFFALFLDRRMVYTCAYYFRPDATLDEAQEAKLDLVCRKLKLDPDDRLLDVGCGWGALTAWAAERYRVRAYGVTLSEAQATHATAMLRAANLRHAQVRCGDYRTIDGHACFEKIAAIGLIEHVGTANYGSYFHRLHRLLTPGGLLVNHGITHPMRAPWSTGMAFLTRRVFPGGELSPLGHTISSMEDAGFDIVDVEALGGHYAATTRDWLVRLYANRDRACAMVGEERYRTWIIYLAAASIAFRLGWIDIHQVVARRPDPRTARRPETRNALYSSR
jgi:cyclopropane-fatty-acyl-phospholipid synthase